MAPFAYEILPYHLVLLYMISTFFFLPFYILQRQKHEKKLGVKIGGGQIRVREATRCFRPPIYKYNQKKYIKEKKNQGAGGDALLLPSSDQPSIFRKDTKDLFFNFFNFSTPLTLFRMLSGENNSFFFSFDCGVLNV